MPNSQKPYAGTNKGKMGMILFAYLLLFPVGRLPLHQGERPWRCLVQRDGLAGDQSTGLRPCLFAADSVFRIQFIFTVRSADEVVYNLNFHVFLFEQIQK